MTCSTHFALCPKYLCPVLCSRCAGAPGPSQGWRTTRETTLLPGSPVFHNQTNPEPPHPNQALYRPSQGLTGSHRPILPCPHHPRAGDQTTTSWGSTLESTGMIPASQSQAHLPRLAHAFPSVPPPCDQPTKALPLWPCRAWGATPSWDL